MPPSRHCFCLMGGWVGTGSSTDGVFIGLLLEAEEPNVFRAAYSSQFRSNKSASLIRTVYALHKNANCHLRGKHWWEGFSPRALSYEYGCAVAVTLYSLRGAKLKEALAAPTLKVLPRGFKNIHPLHGKVERAMYLFLPFFLNLLLQTHRGRLQYFFLLCVFPRSVRRVFLFG